MPEIETARLRLRLCSKGDLDNLFKIRADRAVMRYIGDGMPQTHNQVKELLIEIEKHWIAYGFGRWAITLKPSDEIIGLCGLNFLEKSDEIEIGYLLSKPFWGKGIATEASRACLRYGFENINLERIVAVAYPENSASRKVLEKIGLKYVKTARFYDGILAYYEMLRKDYHSDHSFFLIHDSTSKKLRNIKSQGD